MENSVSIVLPALNEEKAIGKVIDDLPLVQLRKRGYDVDIMVVDGHSVDRTVEIAESKGARLVRQFGRGKGCAVRTAFDEFDGKYLFMIDADDTYPSGYLIDLLDMLESGKYDVVIGSRLNGHIMPGAMSRMNWMGNKVLTGVANAFFPNGHKTTDICTGMWGFERTVPKTLPLSATHFEIEAEMFAQCIKQGFRIGEIPIVYRRRGGPSKLGSIRAGSRIGMKLVREKMLSR